MVGDTVDSVPDLDRLLASVPGNGLDPASQAQSDLQLVEACHGGEPGAWDQLIRRHAGLIYAVARRYGLSQDDAADVFQSVCVDLWEQLDSVRDASVLRRWLVVVAGRKSWQARRSRDRFSLQSDVGTGESDEARSDFSTEDIVLAHADVEHLQGVLERLSPRDRELVWCLFFDPTCPSYETIARRLGVSPETVGSLRTRCLRRLRWVLAEHVA